MTAHDDSTPAMHRRRTTMFDGRTMYYYSFGDEALAAEALERDTAVGDGGSDEQPGSPHRSGDRAATAGAAAEDLDV